MRLSAIAFVLLLVSCGPPPLERYGEPPSQASEAVLETCDFLSGLDTRRDLEAAFGQPLGEDVTSVPNNHVSGQTDQLHTVKFDAAEVVYLVSETASRPILLGHSRIHEPLENTHLLGLIGSSEAAVVEVLGPPDYKEGPDLLYSCGEVNLIRMTIEGDAVVAVVWQPYTG